MEKQETPVHNFSKIKKPNKYCLENQTKFLIFLRNNRDCIVVDPYKARNMRRKFQNSTRKICTKLAFPPQQKTDTTAQLYCTLSTYVPKTISRQIKKPSTTPQLYGTLST